MTRIYSGPLDEAGIAAAGAMLAAAFHDDPLQMHVFPDARERAQRSPAQFCVLVRQGSLFGEVLASEAMTGVSVWMPPGVESGADEAARSGFRDLPALMGTEAFERFGRVLDYLSAAPVAPGPTWYLMIIGVRPELRGRGLGHELLAPILARADRERVPIHLDTARPQAKAFYEKLGFRIARDSVDPGSGVRFWSYVRDPGRSAGHQRPAT
jgi:ribosomal protein S18 acetylase RimI-like enzyme